MPGWKSTIERADSRPALATVEVFEPIRPHADPDEPPWPSNDCAPKLTNVMTRRLVTIGAAVSVGGARQRGAALDVHHMLVVAAPPAESGIRVAPTGRHRLFGGEGIDVTAAAGIVCSSDLDAWPPDATVRQAMTFPVFCVAEGASIAAVAAIMRERSIGALPVLARNATADGGTLVGIITRRDLRRVDVPEAAFTGQRCAVCDGKRRVRWDTRTDGFAICCACRSNAETRMPDAETGVGD